MFLQNRSFTLLYAFCRCYEKTNCFQPLFSCCFLASSPSAIFSVLWKRITTGIYHIAWINYLIVLSHRLRYSTSDILQYKSFYATILLVCICCFHNHKSVWILMWVLRRLFTKCWAHSINGLVSPFRIYICCTWNRILYCIIHDMMARITEIKREFWNTYFSTSTRAFNFFVVNINFIFRWTMGRTFVRRNCCWNGWWCNWWCWTTGSRRRRWQGSRLSWA